MDFFQYFFNTFANPFSPCTRKIIEKQKQKKFLFLTNLSIVVRFTLVFTRMA